MKWRFLFTILFSTLVMGAWAGAQQGQPSGEPPEKPPASDTPTSVVPMDSPVITWTGLCDNGITTVGKPPTGPASAAPPVGGPATKPDCKTVMTRDQFETLAKALGMKPGRESALFSQYSEMMKFGARGLELGADKDPRFLERARYAYLKELFSFSVVRMQEQANDFTDAELEKYYKEHPEQFVKVDVSQLAIPKEKSYDSNPALKAKANKAADAAEMKRVAVRLQKEAVAGVNFNTLEDRAYKAADDESPPDTDLGERFADQVPEPYRSLIFNLKPGQVSALSEDSHEYLVFKARKRTMLPLSESRHWYGQLIMRGMRRDLNDAVKMDLNEQYFGKAPDKQSTGADAP
jgi:hypothetical protein